MVKVTLILEEDNGQVTLVTDKVQGFIDEVIEVITRGLVGHTFPEGLVKDYINVVDGAVYKIGE